MNYVIRNEDGRYLRVFHHHPIGQPYDPDAPISRVELVSKAEASTYTAKEARALLAKYPGSNFTKEVR